MNPRRARKNIRERAEARGTTPLDPRRARKNIRERESERGYPLEPRGHDSPPYTQGSRLWVITPQLMRHQPTS